MGLLSDIQFRLRALWRRSEMEQDLDDELHFHLEQECAKHVARGVAPAEAMHRARLAFGGIEQIKEASRDSHGLGLIELLRQDLRYATRSLRRQPGFTLAVILTLSLGIGANAVMFGVVDQLLFRDPPTMEDAARVHRVYFGAHWNTTESRYSYSGYTRYLDLLNNTSAFDRVAAFQNRTVSVGSGDATREMRVGVVSASFFDLFSAKPILGRVFPAAEDQVTDGAQVAVLSYGYWQGRHGGDRNVLGTTVQVGTAPYTIIGVMPPGFVGLSDNGAPAMFVPITSYARTVIEGSGWYSTYSWTWHEILVRRKTGITIAEANTDLSNAFRRSWETERATATHPMRSATEAQIRAFVSPVQHSRGPVAGPMAQIASWVSGVTLIVLLIACANVANLMLARAMRRRREISVRLALGVSRGRLALQLFTEAILLAVGGAAAGLLVAQASGPALHRIFLEEGAAERQVLDLRTMIFAVVATLLTGVITSLTPIIHARRTDIAASLKASARQGGQHHSRLRTGLLLLQAALAVVLLIGAALFVRSLQHVQAMRLGFDVDHVVLVSPTLRGNRLKVEQRHALNSRLLETARGLPGVEQASLGITVPFWDNASQTVFVEGIDSTDRLGSFTLQSASPGYLGVMGTRLLKGRDYTDADREGGPPVMVVSDAMAAALWPNRDPLGQCVRLSKPDAPCTTVIGVVENIHQRSMTEDSGLHYYTPIAQTGLELSRNRFASSEGEGVAASLFVRVRGDADDQAESLRRALQAQMPGTAYVTVQTMRSIIDPNLRSWLIGAVLFLAFGGLAVILAAIGLYSVIAYDVAQRTQELGVRMALGARVATVVHMVMRDGLRVAIAGIALGSMVALVAGRWLQPLLFAQSARDPWIYAGIAAVLLLVATLATLVPALRAARVNPSHALRSD